MKTFQDFLIAELNGKEKEGTLSKIVKIYKKYETYLKGEQLIKELFKQLENAEIIQIEYEPIRRIDTFDGKLGIPEVKITHLYDQVTIKYKKVEPK